MPSKPATPPLFGHIPGVEVGDHFRTRLDVMAAGLHRQARTGVSGTPALGCEAIIVCPAYEDDRDLGDLIYYSGQGGRNSQTGSQCADQQPNAPLNQALLRSIETGLPVRVIRKVLTDQGPQYRYDGLYRIVNVEEITGKSGYRVLLFEVRR